jgi:hypothetical protein
MRRLRQPQCRHGRQRDPAAVINLRELIEARCPADRAQELIGDDLHHVKDTKSIFWKINSSRVARGAPTLRYAWNYLSWTGRLRVFDRST